VSDVVEPGFAKYTVTSRAFDAQMKWLATHGYTSIDLATLLAGRRSGQPATERSVVITFDDGFKDCATYAAKSLRAHGMSGTFFLVAGLMGGPATWLRTERGIEPPLMTWDDARALEADGHRCASHSMTHPRLAKISREQCRTELAESRACIERELGHDVTEIAYPFGSESDDVRRLAAECGYTAACTVQIALSRASDDALGLPRVPVLGGDSLLDFASRVRTAYTVRDRLTELARSVVGAGRGSSTRDDNA
jgi:peptidoglycan/xylan/chitin deacetylase (PgdA/CDA1 family)